MKQWILALAGIRRTEEMGRDGFDAGFRRFQIPAKNTAAPK